MFPKFSRDLKIIALMPGDIDKSTVTGKFEIGLGCASADGLFRLAVKISPKMPRNRRRLDTNRVCCALQNAGFIKKFNDQISRLMHPQASDHAGKLTGFEGNTIRQAINRVAGPHRELAITLIRWIAPFILGLKFDLKRLTHIADSRRHRQKPLRLAGDNLYHRLVRHRLVAKGRNRVDQRMKFIRFLAKCLQPHPRRPARAVTKRDGDAIPFAQKSADNFDIKRAIPRPYIAFRVIMIGQHSVI